MYLEQKDNGIISLLTFGWDDEDLPRWGDVIHAISKVQHAGFKSNVHEIENDDNVYAIVVAPESLSEAEAYEMYENQEDYFL